MESLARFPRPRSSCRPRLCRAAAILLLCLLAPSGVGAAEVGRVTQAFWALGSEEGVRGRRVEQRDLAERRDQRRRLDPREAGKLFLMLPLPAVLPRIGLVINKRPGGRPSIDGLALQALPNLRISASGDIDLDRREISALVRLHLDF